MDPIMTQRPATNFLMVHDDFHSIDLKHSAQVVHEGIEALVVAVLRGETTNEEYRDQTLLFYS